MGVTADVCVLGGVRVSVDGRPVALGGVKPRAILAFLAVQPDVVVPVERIVDGVWGESAPKSVRSSLQMHVSALRRAVDDADGPELIATRPGGYSFVGPREWVDAVRFEQAWRAAAAARGDGRDIDAVEIARDALELWRGVPFAGLADVPFVAGWAAGMERDYGRLIELLADAEAALGRPSGAVAELERLVGRYPYRESAWLRLASALHRCGRRADALARLREHRQVMVEELGLDPSIEINALELQILSDDSPVADPAAARPHDPDVDRQLAAARTLLREGAALAAAPVAAAAIAAARDLGQHTQTAKGLLLAARIAAITGSQPAEPLIVEAQALARALDDFELLAAVALAKFGHGVPADWTTALGELAEPLDGLAPDAPQRVELLCAAAAILVNQDGLAASGQLVALAEETDRVIGSARSRTILLTIRAITSDLAEASARSYAVGALELAREVEDPQLVVVASMAALRVALASGALADVEALVPVFADVGDSAGLAFGRVRVPICRAVLALARGQLDRVEVEIAEIRAHGAQFGALVAGNASTALTVQLAFERDEGDRFVSLLRQGAAAGASAMLAAAALLGGPDDVAALHAATEQIGATDMAVVVASLAASAAVIHGDERLAKWCVTMLANCGDQVAEQGYGALVVGPTQLFLGIAHLTCGDWEAADSALARGESLAERAGANLWLAEARLWRARAAVAFEDDEAAVKLLDAAAVCPGWTRLTRLAASIEAMLHAAR